jgi:hypothetical protein
MWFIFLLSHVAKESFLVYEFRKSLKKDGKLEDAFFNQQSESANAVD